MSTERGEWLRWGSFAVAGVALGGALWLHETRLADRLDALTRETARLSQQSATAPAQVPASTTIIQSAPLDQQAVDAISNAVAARVAPPRPVPTPPDEPTEEQHAAAARANGVIHAAIGRHRWRREDQAELRKELAAAGGAADPREVGLQIARAINSQELAVDDPHFVIP